MLTIRPRLFIRPLTIIKPLTVVLMAGALLCPSHARAADPISMNLLFEPELGQDNTYRQENHDKTINIMLYGLKDSPASSDGVIPKDKKALNAFFKQHWESIRRDYLGDDVGGMHVMAGEDSFASRQLNQSIDSAETAKMVGLTIPVGKFTIGGGYTWGEKNPALMLKTTEGFFGGASYDAGRVGYQISYLTSGEEIAGFKIGGTNVHYNSVLVGTSFRVNNRLGLTATAQYRQDDDPLTTGRQQAVFTVGTKWKF